MICPLCTEDGFVQKILDRSGEWYNGRIKRLNPRVLYGTHTCTLLVSCCYKCACGHQITACHPDILKMLKGKIDIPFFLTHKNGFTSDLAAMLEDLVDSGLSFEQIENLIKRQYKTTYDLFEINFWRNSEVRKNRGLIREQTSFVFPKFYGENFPCPGNNILIDIFLKHFFQDEQVYIDAMSSLSAKTISCDHTFKSVCNIGYRRQEDGNWVTQYNSIFCTLNEKGEVLSWQFTKSESFPEVRDMFVEIKERLENNDLDHICIDNCCKWQSLLNEIFPEASVKQDLFHAVQRFVKTLKKRDPIQRDVAADFGKIFQHPQDMGDTRKMTTPSSNILLSNLDNFSKKWKNHETRGGVEILNRERLGAINNIRGHIIKGCLSDIPVHCSTSINERLHKDMKKLLANNRMGTQLAYAKFSRYIFRHNQLHGINQETIYSLRANMEQRTFKGVNSDFISRKVHFGIRPKDREMAGIPSVFKQLQLYTIDDLTPAVLDDVTKKIKMASTFHPYEEPKSMPSSLPDHTYSCSVPNKTDRCLIAIIDYSFSIYKVILTMKKLWSSKSENLLKIPFLFQNFKTYLSSRIDCMENSPDMSEFECDRLQNLASSFGFSIVQVSGNGNCFFRAVAFQLSHILSSPSCPDILRNHMQNHGIENHLTVEQITTRLRELIVSEWQENELSYSSFFERIDMHAESEQFRISGEFAGPLGDTMPLAMANVLNMPVYILTSVHNFPFLSVFPHSSVNGDTGIFLSHNQEGPEHYDTQVFQASPRTTDHVEGSDNILQPEGKW